MFEASCEKLSAEQSTRLANLLSEYSDVFAEDEFDLGNFTSIEHTIDTADAKPINKVSGGRQLVLQGRKKHT